jgi:hypothetical protein
MKMAEDFCYKVWIVEVGSSVDAPTLLLEAVFLTPAA